MKQKTKNSLSGIVTRNFKQYIEEHMTQEEAASILGFSEDSHIRRIYRAGLLKIDEIQRVADCFEIPLSDLFKGFD